MLQPSKDRLDYGSLLMPPEGYYLENAIATSYSINLDALISIPVALYFSHSLELDLKQDIVQVLDSIRRASDTIKVFCQKGQISVPDNQHRLYSFIEPCIVQVPPSHRHSFHPKVWVIKYKNNLGDIKFRVIVLSRNLTFDRSWDVAFQLDGNFIEERQRNYGNTKPLIDFIKYLGTYEEADWFEDFISDLGKTNFQLNSNEFESFTFEPSGFPGYKKNVLFNNQFYDDMLIISPFLTNSGLDIAKKYSINKAKLFSREYELNKINQQYLGDFSVYHLVNEFVEGEEKIESDTDENISAQLQDLHAKVYSCKLGWDAVLLLGSANCSERAMHRNVEFMIQLKGKNSKIGPDALFKELVNEDLNVFQLYTPSEPLSEQQEELNSQEEVLQNLKVDIVNSIITANANKQEDSNFSIEFVCDLANLTLNAKVEATAYLLNNKEQSQELKLGDKTQWTVYNIAEIDLSCFLIIELRIKGTMVALRFVLKIQINNLPESRSSRIFKDIISNTANFFKYIRFLLAENYWDEEHTFNGINGKPYKGHGLGDYMAREEPIYENMLKAISREPEKLTEIKTVMDKLSEEGNGEESIIPEDFKTLWRIFEEIKLKDK
ncbi:hypothetical protein SAMN05444285_10699 [Draconibacterium orientale]|uniref:PLD phosphodiesterase domain-containing protein n=1 Tax=Draconibacterium orientale TaxID=1168034 RepID=A0A1I0BZW9_9BACT|nr:phospholipase D family protein [Draconibacterium orientale]SET12638.1 hypothetical protein SAMN05444285_10699 [Draconibacterium orientale]